MKAATTSTDNPKTRRGLAKSRADRSTFGFILFSVLSSVAAGAILAPALSMAQSANQVYVGCRLNPQALAGLRRSINAAPNIDEASIAFAVIYTLQNDNNGQPLSGASGVGGQEFTGPVVCRNRQLTDPFTEVDVNTPIPQKIERNPDDYVPGVVNTQDVGSAYVLRYENVPAQFGPSGDGPNKTRFCHTVDSLTQCFDIPFDRSQ